LEIEYYDFNEHIDSVEWIYSLPKGLVSEKIDLRHSTVTITKLDNGYQVYVGPKNLDIEGSGLLITLDKNHKLKDYVIERVDPPPY
jgi:hypothetical protein